MVKLDFDIGHCTNTRQKETPEGILRRGHITSLKLQGPSVILTLWTTLCVADHEIKNWTYATSSPAHKRMHVSLRYLQELYKYEAWRAAYTSSIKATMS